ncbi:hypothetical protein MUK42_31096 [Musa troglodytarum]|uniref:DUF659 domain-containing protein n=1 Tax=Musa troglodytarum TaxID=320322 RepID=A0A9E7K8N3_9LILI|nr:hypothetical protein MUK42_31096 [Musa troglodytarum]
MSTVAVEDTIEEHGTSIDEERRRVRCKYCGKEVNGFNRLKHHLAAVGSDVTACIEVPAVVKTQMRDALLGKKKERLLKEVGRIEHPELPLKRNFSPASSKQRCCQLKLTPGINSVNSSGRTEINVGESSSVNNFCPKQFLVKGVNTLEPHSAETVNWCSPSPFITKNMYRIVKEEVKDESAWHAARCIGRFFFEAGIDTANVKLPSFQVMMDAVIGCGSGYKVPTYDELKGTILHEEVKEVLKHVEDVKQSWGQTGCSILLDGWTDPRGRSLISFLVNCPLGTIFLRSVDASDAVDDVDTLFLLVCNVIEEVVVAHDTSDCIEAAGKKIMEKYRSIFWTLSADYCINIIFEKIEAQDYVKKVLSDAKAITKFIYSNALPLKLLRKHVRGGDLVRTSNLKSVTPFITLQNMVSERENLVYMFNSPTWTTSDLASKIKGKSISKLVKDSLFWVAAVDVLKITDPLLDILHQISGTDRSPMSFLYDSIDRAKEKIKRNLGHEVARYDPIWTLVDDIWDNHLHSPLHSAGYFLNPSLFYLSDFYIDAEVINGILYCIVKMTVAQQDQELIVLQLDEYREAKGVFSGDAAVDQRSKISPALGRECLAVIEVVSALRYVVVSARTAMPRTTKARRQNPKPGMQWCLKLHTEGRNCMEQQRSHDLEFVHYNRRLWHSPSRSKQEIELGHDDLKPLEEWIVDGN